MPRRSLSVSISVPTELDEQIEEEAQENDMSYSEFVRTVLRNSTETSLEPADVDLVTRDDAAEEAQMGGA